MKLIPEWRRVLKHAWSVRFMALACAASGLNELLPYLSLLPLPQWLVTTLIVAAVIARFIPQKKVSGSGK